MNAKVADLMSKRVIHAQPHHTVSHVQALMTRNQLHAVPIVNTAEEPVGIVSSADLVGKKGESPVSKVMTEGVYTIPQYNDIHQAARAMRNHRIHHLVVTHERAIVGMLSSFDLLRLVEDHRFVMKPGPTPKRSAAKLK